VIDRDGVGPPFLPFEVHYADTHGAQGLQVVWRGVDDAAFPTEVPPRTNWTRRVPHPVLIGHAASLTSYR
jgi:hypothetical protein